MHDCGLQSKKKLYIFCSFLSIGNSSGRAESKLQNRYCNSLGGNSTEILVISSYKNVLLNGSRKASHVNNGLEPTRRTPLYRLLRLDTSRLTRCNHCKKQVQEYSRIVSPESSYFVDEYQAPTRQITGSYPGHELKLSQLLWF